MGDYYSGKGRERRRNNENQKQGVGRDEWTIKSSNQVPYPDKHFAVDDGSIGRLSLTETPARPESLLNPNAAEFEVRGATFVNSNNFQTSSQDGKPTPKPTGRLDNSYGRRNSNQGTQKSWASIASSEPSNVYRTSIPFVPQFKEGACHNQNNFNKPATANSPDFKAYNIPDNSYKSDDHHDKWNSNEQSVANVTSNSIKECAFYQNPQNEQSVKVSAPEENLAHIDGTDDNFKKYSSPLEGSQNTKSFYPRGKPYRGSADNTRSSFSDRNTQRRSRGGKRNGEHGKWNAREKKPYNEDEGKSNEWNKQQYNADKGKSYTRNKRYNADEGKSNAWNKQQYNPDEGKSKAWNKQYNADEGKSNAWNKQYNADEGKSTVSNKQPYNVDEQKEFHQNPQKEELNTRMEENSEEYWDADETMQGEYSSEVNKSCVLDDNKKNAGEGKYSDDKEKMIPELGGDESNYKNTTSQDDSSLTPDGGAEHSRQVKSGSINKYCYQKSGRDSRENFKNDGTDTKKRADDKEKMPEEVRITGELDQYWDGNESSYKKSTTRRSDSPLAPDDGGPRYCRDKSDSVDPYHYQKKSARDSRGNSKNVSMQNFDTKKRDDLFDEYDRNYRYKNMVFKRVVEVDGDLFSAGTDYALAHCVAEDMNMGSGIALTFRKTFGCVTELLAQKEKQGGLAHLKHEERNVYYLVTKRDSNRKPTLLTMFKSVNRLKKHMVENGVGKVAIPRLGCGLDRLEWSEVKNMLEYVFGDTEIEIKVFNFQQAQAQMEAKSTDHSSRKCRVNNLNTTIKDFYKKYTMILYLGTEEGDDTPEIKAIDERFNMLGDYKSRDKKMGSYITTYKNNSEYCLIGIIAKKKKSDPFDFVAFGQAVTNLNKENQKAEKSGEKYGNAAIHRYEDPNDDIFMTKITNLLRNTFYKVEINLLDL